MNSISKNVYVDKVDDVFKKYNNTYHTSIKMKPVDVKDNIYIYIYILILKKKPIIKILNLKLVIM